MSLRRSTRLGSTATPTPTSKSSSQSRPKVTRVQNAITKPRKVSAAKKAAPDAVAEQVTDTGTSYWSPNLPAERNRHLTPPSLDRPVDPHRTNAVLQTPHGTSVTVDPSREREEDVSPSKTAKTGTARPPVATTGTLLEQATAHLIAADPRLKSVVEQNPCPLFSPTGLAEQIDPFNSLVSSIIGQQVSGAAAKSIREKFLALFNIASPVGVAHSRFALPEEVAKCDIPTLRTAGLSQRKAEYIQGLAEKFATGELSVSMLAGASDEELFEKLVAVRGLGKWSVEMFAVFALKRTDIFATGDLGVQYVGFFLSSCLCP